ncbi:MAG TPA: GNAT family protein [Candidatus Limnocylindrales bacterium]|nr:GNAT family protein [Candidatus Limnocylindrales bacterium]
MTARRDGTVPIIRHGRVYLRPAERSDIPLFVRWLNDARTSRTLAAVAPLSIPLEEAWFERTVEAQGRDGYHFTICLLEDDRPIGTVGLFGLDLRNGNAALGITIGDPADTNQGLGTDALRALVGWAFDMLRLERVWLDVYDFNPRARSVYERIGFVFEGTQRHAIFRHGAFVDVHRLAVLSGEWRALQAASPEPRAGEEAR